MILRVGEVLSKNLEPPQRVTNLWGRVLGGRLGDPGLAEPIEGVESIGPAPHIRPIQIPLHGKKAVDRSTILGSIGDEHEYEQVLRAHDLRSESGFQLDGTSAAQCRSREGFAGEEDIHIDETRFERPLDGELAELLPSDGVQPGRRGRNESESVQLADDVSDMFQIEIRA